MVLLGILDDAILVNFCPRHF